MILTHTEDQDAPKKRARSRPSSTKKSGADGEAGSSSLKKHTDPRQPIEMALECHDACKRVLFSFRGPTPFAELKHLYFDAFGDLESILDLEPTCAEYVDAEMPAFELQDPDYKIFYEEFNNDDLFEGAAVRVNARRLKSKTEIQTLKWEQQAERVQQEATQLNPSYLKSPAYTSGSVSVPEGITSSEICPARGRGGLQGNPAHVGWQDLPGVSNQDGPVHPLSSHSMTKSLTFPGPSGASVPGRPLAGDLGAAEAPEPSEAAENADTALLDKDEDGDIPELPRINRVKACVWTTLNDPISSNLAATLTLFLIVTIVFSTIVFLAGSYPHFKADGNLFGGWFIAETVPAVIFTLEVLARLWSCPTWRAFWLDAFNIIDLISVVPYYISLIFLLMRTPVPVILRMLRVIRILRLIKISKGSVTVFIKAMMYSMSLLYMLLFMALICNLVFASLIYYTERGRWNPILGVFERPSHFLCPVFAADNATGDLLDDPSVCQPPLPSFPAGADYACKYSWRVSPDCLRVHTSGPYHSIWHSTWFVMQTITTVGFGNDTPVTGWGKTISSIIIMFGLVVLSLPITVIGTNFSRTYKSHQRMLAMNQEVMMYHQLSFLQKIAFNLVYS